MPSYNDPSPKLPADPSAGAWLDIGSGEQPLKGCQGVDPYIDAPNITKAPMWDLPYEDGVIAYIYSSHALEHVGLADVVPTLSEWGRVLADDGYIELRVPNLVWCVQHWLQHQDNGWSLATIYGHQAHGGEYHKTGFTRRLMEGYIAEAGLVCYEFDLIWTHSQETMRFIIGKG